MKEWGWLIGLLGIIIIVGVIALVDRAGSTSTARVPTLMSNKEQYFNNPQHRFSRDNAAYVEDVAALGNQHQSGRHMDINGEVYVNFGCVAMATEFEVVNHARWIYEHGSTNGVELHAMDGNREMTAAELKKVLYGKR